jgi:thioredoxin reductase (NADPH)
VLTDVAAPVTPATARTRLPYETAVDGMFAAGDIRAGSMKRVAAAVGDGSSVIQSVHQYLTKFPDAELVGAEPPGGAQPGPRSSQHGPEAGR